jgi:hypothetical protein
MAVRATLLVRTFIAYLLGCFVMMLSVSRAGRATLVGSG